MVCAAQLSVMQHIFHPTDLSAGSATAFLHALRLATAAHTRLTLMHVNDADDLSAATLPQVRTKLAEWGLIRGAHDMDGLMALGLGVKKVLAEGEDPVVACLDYLDRHPADLIVLATHQHNGRTAWLQRRVAEPLARGSATPNLFVPHDRPGFVDPATGAVRLRRILIPVADDPDPQHAVELAVRLAQQLGLAGVYITLLHVGDQGSAPRPELPPAPGVHMEHLVVSGDVERMILQVASHTNADLIVMATKGHEGFLDALRGNTTERVLRQAECPVLAVAART